jgi:hypothetical protein
MESFRKHLVITVVAQVQGVKKNLGLLKNAPREVTF